MDKLIFIVDDNDANLVLAASALDDEFKVLTMPSAKKMLALLEKKTADMILLDVEMPDMTGIEAAASLRQNQKFKDIPIILLTSRNEEEIKSDIIKYKILDIIKKPIVPSVLKNCVKKYIGN